MKTLLSFLMLFIFSKSLAQSTNPNAVFVINGQFAITDKIQSDTVLERLVVKGKRLDDFYKNIYVERSYPDSIVIITTLKFAGDAYKNKFSKISKKYANYLSKNKNDDSDLTYIVNGIQVVKENKNLLVKQLYAIPFKNIIKVDFKDNFLEGMKMGATIVIRTKN